MSNSMRTPLGQVRGLGSARDGVGHFIKQRGSAIVLAFLTPWLLINVLCATRGVDVDARYAHAVDWIGNPVNGLLAILTVGAALYHMRLGLQVVIEDYIHAHGTKLALLLLNTVASVGLFAAAAFAVLKLAI